MQDDRHAAAHRSLLLSIFIFTPLFLLTVAGLVLSLITGAIVLAVIAALVAFLFGYQSIQSLRDLGEEPKTLTGEITRRWSRADFVIFGQSYYVMVQRKVFRTPVEKYLELDRGDTVQVTYYPHTNTVVDIVRETPA